MKNICDQIEFRGELFISYFRFGLSDKGFASHWLEFYQECKGVYFSLPIAELGRRIDAVLDGMELANSSNNNR